MGECIVVETADREAVSPCNATVISVTNNGEYIDLQMDNHIIVQVQVHATKTKSLVEKGQKVTTGQKLVQFSEIPVKVTTRIANPEDFVDIMKIEQASVKAGDRIIAVI